MIQGILLLLFSMFTFSCVDSPIKYYPPRHSQPQPAKKSSPLQPGPVVSSKEISTSVPSIVANPSVLATPAQGLPSTVATVSVQQKTLLAAVKNPLTSKAKMAELIEAEKSITDLDKAISESTSYAQSQPYRPQLLFKAGELAQRAHKPDLALQYYRSLVSQFPQSGLAAKANSEMLLIQASEDTDSKVIGAILPLTGKNANIGQHALNSLRLGLGLNKPDARQRLAIFDSQGSAELAKAGVEKLVREDKVIAIIGGLSSKEALAAGQKSDRLGVPFIGLSQKSGLTSVGDYVFRNSLTAEMQVDRLVSYAFEKLGAKRFAVLYPNDAYGVEFANIYWDHVLARGGQITAAQTYDSKENDFTIPIQKLVGTFFPEGRAEEYQERLEELALEKKEKSEKNKNKVASRAHDVQENILPPRVDFDVLFIPDTGKSLGQVMAFLKVSAVTKMIYLGTNIWNSPDLAKRAGTHANGVYFVDALDMNDPSARETSFFKDYVSSFSEEPGLIEMQVFESAKIVRGLLSEGASSRESLASNLRSLGRTDGITGQLRMSSQRELERPLHILSLDAGQIKKIE